MVLGSSAGRPLFWGRGMVCVASALLTSVAGIGAARAQSSPSAIVSACSQGASPPALAAPGRTVGPLVKGGNAIELDLDKRVASHINWGMNLLRTRNYDRALEEFDQAIKLYPTCAFGFVARGNAYAGKGEYDRAIADYDRAIELNPALADADTLSRRAFAYSRKGDYGGVIRDLDAVLQRDPGNASALNNRRETRTIVGALDEALEDCQKSLRMRPDHAPTLDSRGLVYLKKGALDEAIADYDAAIRIDPRLPHPLYGRGVAKRMKGDIAGSEADIAAAKAINPGISDYFARAGIKE